MMFPWLDYKGLTYFSRQLREKLKKAFSDIYDDITDITDAEIEELFEEDDTETLEDNSLVQNFIEDNKEESLSQNYDEDIDKELDLNSENISSDGSSDLAQQTPLAEDDEDNSSFK